VIPAPELGRLRADGEQPLPETLGSDGDVLPESPGEVDAVVVGGGAAGLAAAIWIARYRRSVLVVDSGEHRNDRVEVSHGYLGRDPQVPAQLLERGRQELLAYPSAALRHDRVRGIRRRPDGLFAVALDGDDDVLAHRLVLATGVLDVKPDVEGIEEHYGASVFHCPACDGYEARDRHVVALGWDAQLAGFAATLLAWACSVTVVTNGATFGGDDSCRTLLDRHSITLLEQKVTGLVGERGALRAVRLDDGRELPCELVFFSVDHQPRTGLAEALGCELDDDGYVRVDDQGLTTVPGVYAAGDLVPGLQLTQVAAASGTVAGVALAQSMFGETGAPTSIAPPPDAEAELAAGR
jgi:thioredoxin reductase